MLGGNERGELGKRGNEDRGERNEERGAWGERGERWEIGMWEALGNRRTRGTALNEKNEKSWWERSRSEKKTWKAGGWIVGNEERVNVESGERGVRSDESARGE